MNAALEYAIQRRSGPHKLPEQLSMFEIGPVASEFNAMNIARLRI